MNIAPQSLILDINLDANIERIIAHQNDNKLRKIAITLIDNSKPIIIAAEEKAYFTATINNAIVAADTPCGISANTINVDISPILSFYGTALCEIYVKNAANERITGAKFNIDIIKDVIDDSTTIASASLPISKRIEDIENGTGIKNGSISGEKIRTNTITGGIKGNIMQDTIDNFNIKNGSISGEKIGTGEVGEANIENGAITEIKLSSNVTNSFLKFGSRYTANPDLDSYVKTGFYGLYGAFYPVLLCVFDINDTIMQVRVQSNVINVRNRDSAGVWTSWRIF